MFVLKTVQKSGVIEFQKLGTHFIQHIAGISDEFGEVFSLVFNRPPDPNVEKETAFGFVVAGGLTIPLYREDRYYLLTQEGDIFETIQPI